MTLTDLVEEYPLSVVLGIAVPRLAIVTRASTLVFVVTIGSISLTLSIAQCRRIDRRTL